MEGLSSKLAPYRTEGSDTGFYVLSSRDSGSRGFGLIEIVIVSGIVSMALFGFLQASITAVRLLHAEKENLEATLLAQESLEAVRSVRDESWTNNIFALSNSVSYYPVVQNGKWMLATSDPGMINNKYTRYIVFDEVRRDTSDRIIASGGTIDTGTRRVRSYTTWGSKQKEVVTYITDFQSSLPRPSESKTIFYEGATTDADLANFPSNNAGDGDPVQGFTTVTAINVTKVELYLKRITSAPSDVYAELRASPIGAVPGTSNIITASTISNSALSWVEFRFPDPVPLSATTLYYIRLRSIPTSTDASSGSAGLIHWGYLQTPASPYLGGVARRYVGRLSNPTDTGQQLDQYDYGFRVYALQ